MKMSTKIFLVLCLSWPVFFLAQKKQLITTITYIQPYCGGARPTPEMEQEAATPKTYSRKTIVFVSESGKVDSIKTDANGLFKKKLPVGRYHFYESWRYYKRTPDGSALDRFSPECMVDEWKKEFMTVNVYKKLLKIEKQEPINLHCDWAYPCLKESHMPPRRE